MGEAKRRKKSDETVVEGVIEGLRVGKDPNTGQVGAAGAWIKTAADEIYAVVADADEPRRALLSLYVGAAARFIGRLSPDPDFPGFKGLIVSSAITPVERDATVIVAAVETIKRAWSDSGAISAAWAYVITKDQDRFTVSSGGGEAMNALLGLNPGDVARFTGRFSPPFETVPNIELSLVALIQRSGRADAWLEEWFFVSTDRLSPEFRRRVASCQTQNCECFSCGTTIETADQIALIMLSGGDARMVCADCGALPRDELVAKLSVVEGVESSPARFVARAKQAESAIAHCCGLDPDVAGDPTNPEANPYILQARCEMAAWVCLRPITWRLELEDGLPTFSDFLDIRTDVDGHEHLIVREEDPSDWAYCLVLAAGHPKYELCGWLWGHEAKQPRFKTTWAKMDDQPFLFRKIKESCTH